MVKGEFGERDVDKFEKGDASGVGGSFGPVRRGHNGGFMTCRAWLLRPHGGHVSAC